MKIYKTDSQIEKDLQRVEALMNELRLSIEYTANGMVVVQQPPPDSTSNFAATGIITDMDSRDTTASFPRRFDSERLVIPDSY